MTTNISFWRWVLWCGLIAGFGELALLGVLKFALHQMLYLSWHILWMAPLANVILFLCLGTLYAASGRCWSRLHAERTVAQTFLFLVTLGWALMFPALKFYACVLLSSGLAWQIGARLKLQSQLIRHSTAAMLVVYVLVCGGFALQPAATATAALASADKPNVLLIVLDTVRAHNLSVYGYARKTTPHLEQLAAAGTKFEKAFSTAPWTLPSHASMFTGRWPHELSADFRTPLNAQFPTLAETLRQHGYQTAGFVANTYYCNVENGLARGFDHYEDYRAEPAEFLLSTSLSRALLQRDWFRRAINFHEVVGRKTAADINRQFLGWLDGHSNQPFFAFLNFMDAHEPCLPPQEYAQKFGQVVEHGNFRSAHMLRTSWRLQRERVTPAQNQADIDCYDSSISYLDAQLGQLFAELERRKLRQNTLVIVTSDHGEAFGEHGHYGHVDSAYITQLRVPLLMSWPGKVPVGLVISEPVSLRNLAATTLDMLQFGLTLPGNPLNHNWQLNGSCEAHTLHSEINIAPILPRKYKTGERAIIQSYILGNFHVLKNPDGVLELYDYEKDPAETQNLSEQLPGLLEPFND